MFVVVDVVDAVEKVQVPDTLSFDIVVTVTADDDVVASKLLLLIVVIVAFIAAVEFLAANDGISKQ